MLEKRIDRATLHLGSFGTFVAAALGLEAYGIGGLIVATLAGHLRRRRRAHDQRRPDRAGRSGGGGRSRWVASPRRDDHHEEGRRRHHRPALRRPGAQGLASGPTAYGEVDEAQATLGVVRAQAGPELAEIVLGIQRDLWVVMAELATGDENADKLTDGQNRTTEAMVDALGATMDEISSPLRPAHGVRGPR